ncbi:MAG: hypothetical protein EXS29_08345 [Pedosphaera sp.]|nr:hypothetical protein [Pedosphaera sp.]
MRRRWLAKGSCAVVVASLLAVEVPEPLAPEEAARTMRVPPGFHVTLFAGEPSVKQPIGFCIDDRGRLWVAEANNYPDKKAGRNDRIVILEDTDGDGHHDKRTVFYDKLEYVSGIEVGFGGVWVMSIPNFYFIPDKGLDGVPDGPPVVLLDGFGTSENAHNIANGFAWGPDGWLYGTHGRTNWSLPGKPGTPKEQRERLDGGVWRYHPTRHVWESFADGTTNPWGIDWNEYGHAFVCNCVEPHLFHVIQGAYYEPARNRPNSRFTYERIATIADHLHFTNTKNIRAGLGTPEEDVAGGGHAHSGTMIYLGDNWPAAYRGHAFMNNIHGHRINFDRLARAGSGYTATHAPDVLRAADPWFMGVTLAYGPDGGVYVSDWSDTGECHSTKNTRKHTGRIYKITFGKTKPWQGDIAKLSNDELVNLQSHANDWFARHARRVMQERNAVPLALRKTLHAEAPVPMRLRALWALWVTENLRDIELMSLLTDKSEHLRAWAVQLLCEHKKPGATALAEFARMAREEESPLVRLYLASALQRLPEAQRVPVLKALLAREADAQDQNLPLMYWYAAEPVVAGDNAAALELLAACKIPKVRQFITRRMTAGRVPANP